MATRSPRVIAINIATENLWIRSGPATAIPVTFEGVLAIPEPRCEVGMRVVVRDGVPAVDAFHVFRVLAPRGPAITQRLLRAVGAVDKLMALLIEHVTEEAVDAEQSQREGWVGAFQLRRDIEAGRADVAYGGRPIKRPGRGRATPDERLIKVAEIYKAALAANSPPTKAVAAQLPCSYSHAARLVGQARAAGQLPKTTKGRTS